MGSPCKGRVYKLPFQATVIVLIQQSWAGRRSVRAGTLAFGPHWLELFPSLWGYRARIFKLLWSQRIDSKESITPAYEAWRASTRTVFLFRS
jgi:hypothetical protein